MENPPPSDPQPDSQPEQPDPHPAQSAQPTRPTQSEPPPAEAEPTLPPASLPGNPDERQWKTIINLSPLVGLVVPFGNIIAPLVVWLLKKEELPGLEPEGRKVLNFQISYAIYGIVSIVLAMVLSCLIVPIVLPILVGIAWLVLTIIGGVKSSNGEAYEYPLVIRIL